MANTESELLQSLEIFNKNLPDQILALEVQNLNGDIINSMVQLKKHRDALSLHIYNSLRSISYERNEVVIHQNKLFRALRDGVSGIFDPLLWEEIDLQSTGESALTRRIVGHSFATGEIVYYDGTDYQKAIADSSAITNDFFGLFVVIKIAGEEVTFGGPGAMVTVNLGFTETSAIYLSDKIDGLAIDFIPTTQPYQQVGFYADGIFHFNPAPVKIEQEKPSAVNESLVLSGTELQLRDTNSLLSVDLSSLNIGANFKVSITGHLFIAGDLAYFDQSTATYQKAIADVNAVTNDSFALFLVLDVMGPTVTFGIIGSVLEIDLGFSGSPVLYLSDSVEGTVTEAQPSTVPYQQIGYYADGFLFFQPIPIKLEDENNTANESLTLNGTTLELTDGVGTVTADLSSLIGVDTSFPNASLALNGTTLELTDGVGTVTADLSNLGGGASSFSRTIVGHSFAVGELATYNGTDYLKAKVDATALTNDTFALFIVINTTPDEVTFGSIGTVLEINLGITGVSILYLSDDTDGLVVDIQPTTFPYQQIGHYADGFLFFNPVPIQLEDENNTANESLTLNGTTLELTDGVGTVTADLGTLTADLEASINSQPQLTTKGDLFVHNGVELVRLPVGVDGYELVADSTVQEGLRWKKKTQTTVLSFQYNGDLNSSSRGLSAHDSGATRSWSSSGIKSSGVMGLVVPFTGKIKAVKGFISEMQINQSANNVDGIVANFQFYGDHYFNGGNALGLDIGLPFGDGLTANAGGYVDMVGSNPWGREMKVENLDIDVTEGQIIGLAFVPKFSNSDAQAIRDVVLQVILEENE